MTHVTLIETQKSEKKLSKILEVFASLKSCDYFTT